MRFSPVRVALFGLFLVAAPWFVPTALRSQSDAPAAVLTSCKGAVTVFHAGGASAPATFGLPLNDGDEVKTGAGGEAEIMFSAGNWVQIGANSSMRIKGRPGDTATKTAAGNAAKPAASSGSFEVVQSFLKLKNSEGTSSISGLRSAEKAAALVAVSPCQTKVRAARPTFRWKIDDTKTELRLTLYGESGVVWQSDATGVTELAYPADAPALTPGVSYSWTLETSDPMVSPPLRTPAAFFEMIAPADATALDSELTQLDAKKPGPVTYHLMRASLFFDRGLVDDAIVETETALANDPDNASLHAILGRLYAETGRTKDAINEMNKAQQ